ncbi:alpha/beta hydrolase-fold protein [Nocardia sp. NPDC001965]
MPYPRRPRRTSRALLVTAAVLALVPVVPSPGTAAPPWTDPPEPAAPASGILDITQRGDRDFELAVYSAAMNRVIPVRVMPAADPAGPAPVLYLLNGITGGADGGNWFDRTDITEFFRNDQVTVVNPLGGAGSYFTDWRADIRTPAISRAASTSISPAAGSTVTGPPARKLSSGSTGCPPEPRSA